MPTVNFIDRCLACPSPGARICGLGRRLNGGFTNGRKLGFRPLV